MSTPYEDGLQIGQWTLEEVHAHGFRSPEECLAHQEQVYQTNLAHLSELRPDQAKREAERLEGVITATRASLRALMQQQ